MTFIKKRGFDKIDLIYIFLAVGAITTPLAWLAATFIAPFGSVQQYSLVEKSSPWSYLIILASQFFAMALIWAYFKKANKRVTETLLLCLVITLAIISFLNFFPHFATLIILFVGFYFFNHFYFKPEHQKGNFYERLIFIVLGVIVFSYPIYISWYFYNIHHALLDQTLIRNNWEEIPLGSNASITIPKGCLFLKSPDALYLMCNHQVVKWKEPPPFIASLGHYQTEAEAKKVFAQYTQKCCKDQRTDFIDAKIMCLYPLKTKRPPYLCQIINRNEVYTLFFNEISSTPTEALARVNYYLKQK